MWRYIAQDAISGSRAAATDAFLMTAYGREGSVPDPTLRIFTYQPGTLLLGRFQSLSEDVNLAECARTQVSPARRLTGGGPLLMGDDQVAVSLVTCMDHSATPAGRPDMFQAYGSAVCRGVRRLGIECHLRSRELMVGAARIGFCDIVVAPSGAIIFQAFVLVSAEPQLLTRLITAPHGPAPNGASDASGPRLTSVSREKGVRIEPRLARDFIRTGFEAGFGIELQEFPITPLESQYLAPIESEEFQRGSWMDSRSPTPAMNGRAARQTPGGVLAAYVGASAGKIANVILAGDFFGDPAAVEAFEAALRDAPADDQTVRLAADRYLSPGALAGIDSADVAACVWAAVQAAGA